ncbi:MAG: hypothetical protein IJM82_04460, partial [Synergistaceae bacterium]|nr:hypothetical protein [Synergistaceae bacterium]
MIYLVIGLFVFVAVGAFFRQQSTHNINENPENQSETENENLENQTLDLPDEEINDSEEPGFVLSVKPVTDPDMASGATYSAHAPAGEESPYGLSSTEQKSKPKAQTNLLRWCGRTGNIQLENITIPGATSYWSNGECSTPEPSCIDITLPVEFPKKDDALPAEGAESYLSM